MPWGKGRHANVSRLAVLQDRAALVVGGGAVATRKVEGLLPAGAHVTVVAPEVTEALRALADAGRCAWRRKAYDAADRAAPTSCSWPPTTRM